MISNTFFFIIWILIRKESFILHISKVLNQMLDFVVVGKDQVGVCIWYERNYDSIWLAVAVFEHVGDWVKLSLLYESLALGFFWFFFAKSHVLFFSFLSAPVIIWCCLTDESASAYNPLAISLIIWCCLTDESASAYNPLAISLRAYLFDLILFDLFVRNNNSFAFFLRSFLIN